MTSILFVRKPDVYLPELPAYEAYLAKHYPNVKVFQSTDANNALYQDYDINWHFMGVDCIGQGKYVVHEYNSLSTPPFAKIKNFIKRTVNKKPDRRVFLSEAVRAGFGYQDNVPFHLRDMGIDERFFNINKEPEYDFVLAGGLNRGPLVAKLLEKFSTGSLKKTNILLLGDAPEPILSRFKSYENIIFKGRVPYYEMADLIGKARYGLNIQPDYYPFNIQTSTKLLEYCAAGIPVISTDYSWLRQFEAKHKAHFYKLDEELENFDMASLHAFDFAIPNVDAFKWESIISQSNIFSFLGQ